MFFCYFYTFFCCFFSKCSLVFVFFQYVFNIPCHRYPLPCCQTFQPCHIKKYQQQTFKVAKRDFKCPRWFYDPYMIRQPCPVTIRFYVLPIPAKHSGNAQQLHPPGHSLPLWNATPGTLPRFIRCRWPPPFPFAPAAVLFCLLLFPALQIQKRIIPAL